MAQPLSQSELPALSAEQKALYKRRMEIDPWYFSRWVCRHQGGVERVHRPLLYLCTRQAELLAATLTRPEFDGYLTDQIKADFKNKGIDWRNPEHIPKIRKRLKRVNLRLPRGIGKSTTADDGNLWEGVMDPDTTISLGSKADDYAEGRITAMGEIVKSPEFAFWFPERVPTDLKTCITRDSILLAGRKTVQVEATIEGRGITSQWSGHHYRVNRRDDIVGTESGEASLEDALMHLADMSSLRHKFEWLGDLYVGVVTGENDDHSLLAADPDVMSIVMPMEEHNGGTTLENVYEDGILTMPEWEGFSRDGVDQIKAEAKANLEHGSIYLLQNYYMTAHKVGVSMFTRRMVDRALYRILRDDRSELILRPKRGNVTKCLRQWPDQREKPKNLDLNDWFLMDPKKLPASAFGLAADQSVSQNGDEWALGAVCMDWEGVFYVLDIKKGRGYQLMIDELLPFDRRFRSCAKFGLDSNATQGMTIEWIKRTEEFRFLAQRVQKVSAGETAKDLNIRNYVQARMLSENLYINPELTDFQVEMLKYQPRALSGRKKKNVVDNQLDVTWMATTLPTPPLAPESEEAMEVESFMAAERDRRSTDPVTHIMTDSWFDALW